MFATKLHVESEEAIEDPTWEQIETGLLRLDGITVTMVVVAGQAPEESATVGGGAEGRYVVCITHDNRRFYVVLNSAVDKGKVSMVCGGQPGEFDASWCVDQPSMLRAVRTFAMSGERDKAVKWAKT